LALQLAETHTDAAPDLMYRLLKMTDDPDPRVQLQLALSLGELNRPAAGEALAKLALSAGDDVYLSAAVMSSAKYHTGALADAVLKEPSPPAGLLRDLQAMAVAEGNRDLLARLIQPVVAQGPNVEPADQLSRLVALFDLLQQQRTSMAKLSAAKADKLTESLSAVPPLLAKARALAGSATQPVAGRLAAVQALGRMPADRDSEGAVLLPLLEKQNSPALQSAAVKALGRIGADDLPHRLLEHWADFPTDVRSAAIDVLLGREAWALALIEEVRSGHVAPADVDAARQLRLVRHVSAKVKEKAKAVLGDPTEGRAKVVAAYAAVATMTGDAQRGQKVYAQNCATCHRSGEMGVEIGPNLASVAGWPAEALTTAILDPSRSAEPRYLAYTAIVEGGDPIYGLVISETPAAVIMQGLDGIERTIARSRIKSLDCNNRSLMPDGLESAISIDQMADLIPYLHSVR